MVPWSGAWSSASKGTAGLTWCARAVYEVMNAHFERYNAGAYVVNYNDLFPIPQREIDVNPNLLPNNPGYRIIEFKKIRR